MSISFIATFYNEEKTIYKFLVSLFSQSRMPDEIILVDGGSKDNTVRKIQDFLKRTRKVKSKLIIKKGNIAVGRNTAIKNAKNDIITVSDGGCILDKNWLKNISEPFLKKESPDVVSGFYRPVSRNIFEKCLAAYTCVMPDKVDPENFLPSSRSIAFRKNAWNQVGGYPEYLDRCEDLIFDINLKKKGFKFYFANQAVVYWPQRETFGAAFQQFFNYAVGDGTAGYFRPQIFFLFLRYVVVLLFLILFFLKPSVYFLNFMFSLFMFYAIWSIAKNYKYAQDRQAFFILPALQFISDIAVIFGVIFGLLKRLLMRREDV